MTALAELSDPEFQQRMWVEGRLLPYEKYRSSWRYVTNVLWDDTRVLDEDVDVEYLVGGMLVDGPEVARLQRLRDVVNPLLDSFAELDLPDILRHPRWPEVVEAAREALVAMVWSGGLVVFEEALRLADDVWGTQVDDEPKDP